MVTVDAADSRDYRDLTNPARPVPKIDTRPIRRGRLFATRTGQLVATQVAAAVVLVGVVNGPLALAAAAIPVATILAITWVRPRGRWAFEWLASALGYAARPHATPVGAGQAGLLQFVAAGSRVERADLAGDTGAVLVDGLGLTAILELGDPAGMLAEGATTLPSPAALLPPPGPEHPPVLIQLLLSGAPAPSLRAGAGTPANSYRQLTEGRLLGHSRALLAVRVLRAEGWSEAELLRALSGLVRKLVRRLSVASARPLGEAAVIRVIAESAHDDGVDPAQETWSGLRVGGLAQSTFRLHRWPDMRIETARRLVPRLLTLPASATTVALTVGPRPVHGPTPIDLTVRLAAPDTGTLGVAGQALRKVTAAERARVRRLDGEHLVGLAATLPLGGTPTTVPGLPPDGVQPAELVDELHLPVGTSGLMLGRNRHGNPVVIRLFRPEQTRVLLVGGVRGAQPAHGHGSRSCGAPRSPASRSRWCHPAESSRSFQARPCTPCCSSSTSARSAPTTVRAPPGKPP